jgi:hypothetical protein
LDQERNKLQGDGEEPDSSGPSGREHGGSQKDRQHIQTGDHDIVGGNEVDDEEHYETSDAYAEQRERSLLEGMNARKSESLGG